MHDEHHTPFLGWFRKKPRTEEEPPSWKEGMTVLLVLYPVVMLENRFLLPHWQGLPIPVLVFFSIVVSVSLLTWPLLPIAVNAFNWWLLPKKRHRAKITALGLIVMLTLYLLEITLFSFL